MSLAAIRAGVFTTLTACGPYATTEVSACDFGILEGAAACAIVFWPDNSPIEPDRLGTRNSRNYIRRWGISGRVYIKDTGDPIRLLGLMWQAPDDIYNTFVKDDSLNSSACGSSLTSIVNNPTGYVEAAGAIWKYIDWNLTAEEF